MVWTHCPPDPLPWFQLREPLLQLLQTPWLLLPLLALLALGLTAPWQLSWSRRALIAAALMLLASGVYSPAATQGLSRWLAAQLPPGSPAAAPPVVVLVGRGEQIAQATTARAAQLVQQQPVAGVYVSGDSPATAEALIRQGVPPVLVAGDSCARTTWENATRTAAWLRSRHPAPGPLPPVVLITDPWQLPRAAHAFIRQGLRVQPIAAIPQLSPHERNRLALRETAATLLYRLQGRM